MQLLGVLSAEGLVALQRITHDGTNIRACASSSSFRREERIREHLAAARAQVEAMGDPLAEEPRERAARRAAAEQRARRLEAATGRTPGEVVANGGFTTRENVLAVERKGVQLFGSLPNHDGQAEGQLRRNRISEAFYPQAFAYDASADVYRYPAGRTLAHLGM